MENHHTSTSDQFEFSESDFRSLSQIAMSEFGLHLEASKKNLVYSRLAKRLRALKLMRFSDYLRYINSPSGEREKRKLLSALTTNVTHFFREKHHFEYLQQSIMPDLSKNAKGGTKIRIWSAGCSAGHEAYSLACTVLNSFPDAKKHDVKILATDIDEEILKVATKARYPEDQLKAVPQQIRNKYFSKKSDQQHWSVNEDVRELVQFGRLNLISEWPMKGKFDVIMCRNVAIYFNDETQSELWSRFTHSLKSGGHLMVGHSERINGPAADKLTPVGITSYRLKSAA